MFRRARYSMGLAAIAAIGPACNSFGEFDADVAQVELGVDAPLEAVTHDHAFERIYVVSPSGVVVDDVGNRWNLPGALHDVIDVEGDLEDVEVAPRLIVVGADGFVASARHPEGAAIEFEVEDVGTDADLWAVAAERDKQLRIVIVGDDVLIAGTEDEHGKLIWTHPPAPSDGWGPLRDVSLTAGCAVGQAGRMLCTSDDVFDGWDVIELDTDVNLNSFCAYSSGDVVGDSGTMVTYDGQAWRVVRLQPGVDLLACTLLHVQPLLVGANQTIYTVDDLQGLDPLHELDWQPRALDPQVGTMLVGENGRAGRLYQSDGLVLH